MKIKDKRITLGFVFGISLIALGGCTMFSNQATTDKNTFSTRAEQIKQIETQRENIHPDGIANSFVPQYKDNNNICGLAEDSEGNIVAIASNDTCPASDLLKNKFGYTYTQLTDNLSPVKNDGICGYAHYEKEENRLGKADMAQLKEKLGDLENVPVETDKSKCPTLVELSNFVTNSVGVPVRFKYNELNINTNDYPVVFINNTDYLEDISLTESKDISLVSDVGSGDNKKLDKNGYTIPRILQNSEALDFCAGDYKNCVFSDANMSLKNGEEEYYLKTHNGYALPTFLMTRGGWDVCKGDFNQCDFIPDEDARNSGKLVNVVTKEEYHSVIPIEVNMN